MESLLGAAWVVHPTSTGRLCLPQPELGSSIRAAAAAAEGAVQAVARLVRECMEGVAREVALRVPLRVRLSCGPSWGQLQEVALAD